MINSLFHVTVADYAKWRVAFDNNKPNRLAAGATGVEQIYRDLDNPNAITIVVEWNNAENARRFYQDPKLKELIASSGAIGTPEIRFFSRT